MNNQIEIKKPQDCTHYGYPEYRFCPLRERCPIPKPVYPPEITIEWASSDYCSIDTFVIDYSLDGGNNWKEWKTVRAVTRLVYMPVNQDGRYLIRVTGKCNGKISAFDVVKVDVKEEKLEW